MQKLQDSRRFQMQKSKLFAFFVLPFCVGLPSGIYQKSFWNGLTQIERMRNMHMFQLMRYFNLFCVGDNQKRLLEDPNVVNKLQQFFDTEIANVFRKTCEMDLKQLQWINFPMNLKLIGKIYNFYIGYKYYNCTQL